MTEPTLTRVRRATSAKLRGAELPDCFADATLAAESLIAERSPSARRIADKKDGRRAADKIRRIP